MDKMLSKEMLMYYSTALLWGRIIEIKAKQSRRALSTEEKEIRKALSSQALNLPKPLYLFIKSIGDVTDKMGKTTEFGNVQIPTAVAGGFGGYHGPLVDEETHNLFEEIPCLGIVADTLMAASTAPDEPQVNFRCLPPGTRATQNLSGFLGPIGPRRPEMRQILNSIGITGVTFPEMIANTRYNHRLILTVSDAIGKLPTYKNEAVQMDSLNKDGTEAQLITTEPDLTTDIGMRWTERTVQPFSMAADSISTIGASYFCGFQLKRGNGEDNANWCCLQAAAGRAWVIPPEWIQNCNARRELPDNLGTRRFTAVSNQQATMTRNIIRRLIAMPR